MNKLVNKIKSTMINGKEEHHGLSFDLFLYGISKIYEIAVLFRAALYRAGILKSRKLPCFVISIGNLSIGGTGKTPMTIYLSNYLVSLGYKVAVISRGYKGLLEHKGGIVSDGNSIFLTQEQAGDEPYMMAKILKIPVLVGKNRIISCRSAIKKFFPDILVLDDAFQYLKLKRDLNLLLMDAKKPFGNGYLLPRGTLREPIGSILRSDAIILTRSDQTSNLALNFTPKKKAIPIFRSSHLPEFRRSEVAMNEVPFIKTLTRSLSDIKSRRALLFSGIANNSGFRDSCRSLGMIITRHLKFPDHYRYTKKDLERIKTAFTQSDSEIMVTTLKDYTKVSDGFSQTYPLMVLNVKISFDEQDRIAFEKFLSNRINSYFSEIRASK